MNVTAQKFQSLYEPVGKPLTWSNHRTTLPQSALRADSSLREGAGNGCGGLHHSTGCSLKSGGAGDFHRPYETQSVWAVTFIGVHSLSLAFARQLPQGGSRERLRGLAPFNRVLAKIRGCGRFSSPLRNSECLGGYVHRGTLPQSRFRSTAPSGREPGTVAGACTIQPGTR